MQAQSNASSQDAETRQQVEVLLRRISRELREPSTQAWLELDLSMAQLKLLFFTFYRGPATVGQIAGALGVTLPSASATIDRLVRSGLLERRSDPSDRRVVINQVTAEGSALVERLREERRARLRQGLDRLSSEELHLVAEAMTTLARALDVPAPEARPSADTPAPSAPVDVARH